MSDLKNPKLIYFKGLLFLIILLVASGMVIQRDPVWQTVCLVALIIWASARLYYFMFYVIENYVDREYKFAGVYSFILHLLDKTRNQKR